MNANIIIAIDNEIVQKGLVAIIQNGILSSNVINTDKTKLLNKVQLNFYEIAIVEIRKNNKEDFELINNLIVSKNKTRIVVFTNKDLDSRTARCIKFNNLELILNTDSGESIIKKIKYQTKYYKSRNSIKKKRKDKLKSLNNLLSNRELEIGSMLIKGVKLSTIAAKENLAKSTVSTYKRRIYAKTNVNNIIDLAIVYDNYLIPNSQ